MMAYVYIKNSVRTSDKIQFSIKINCLTLFEKEIPVSTENRSNS